MMASHDPTNTPTAARQAAPTPPVPCPSPYTVTLDIDPCPSRGADLALALVTGKIFRLQLDTNPLGVE